MCASGVPCEEGVGGDELMPEDGLSQDEETDEDAAAESAAEAAAESAAEAAAESAYETVEDAPEVVRRRMNVLWWCHVLGGGVNISE